MNKYSFAVITLLAHNACFAEAVDIGVKKTVVSNIEAIRSVLISQGYAVPYASNSDGMVIGVMRNARLSNKEGNCGEDPDYSYLSDDRTQTTVEITFTSSEQLISANAQITSIFHASYGNPDQTLSCTSTGAIEALLLPLIKEAALSMPDEVPLAYPTISKETASPYEAQEVQLNNTPKKPSDAVEIADITMNLREVNYSDAVAMTIHYKSKTSKRIIGVVSRITASNVFGQQVLSDLFEDEIVIEPGELTSGGSFWNWKDNPYIQNEPYDRMWQSVKNYTIKTKATVLKVIFDDGTKVEAATQAPKKRK